MLILTRFSGQSFNIHLEDGQIINVKMLNIQNTPCGPMSRIGIDAPKDITILRSELSIKNTNKNQEEEQTDPI